MVDVSVVIDGSIPFTGAHQRVIAANTGGVTNMVANYAVTQAFSLSGGSHTVGLCGSLVGGSTATVGGSNSSVTRSTLTVTFLKQ